jgi:hypothetical protein
MLSTAGRPIDMWPELKAGSKRKGRRDKDPTKLHEQVGRGKGDH